MVIARGKADFQPNIGRPTVADSGSKTQTKGTTEKIV